MSIEIIFSAIVFVWLIGIAVSYLLYLKKQDMTDFDKVWLALFWPLLLPLYVIHVINNKW